MLLQTLASIATKLELNEDQILTIHCFNRGMLGKLGIRQAFALISDIVERYDLEDERTSPSYGAQLVRKGVLTSEEGYLFAEGYVINGPSKEQQQSARSPETQSSDTFDGKA